MPSALLTSIHFLLLQIPLRQIAVAAALCALLAPLPGVVATVQANEDIGDDQRSFEGDLEEALTPPPSHDVPSLTKPSAIPDATAVEPGLHVHAGAERRDADAPLEAEADAEPGRALTLLGETVAPGSMSTLHWSPQDIFEGIPVPTPVLVANGAQAGPVLCMTGAIHGDEINSIETIRRVMFGIDPEQLSGSVIGVPIVNQMGFRRSSRYLPDRRDLNRYFPGSATGSSAARIAHSLFHEVILHCDALIDLHTGSFYRTNIPQLRADLTHPRVRELTEHFGDIVVLHSEGSPGMLRREATLADIPTVTLEAGESLRIQQSVIKAGAKHINALLGNLKMVKRGFSWGNPQPVYMASRWLRAESGGIFISNKKPGDTVAMGDKLGTITDPINNNKTEVRAEFDGRILGMAMNQVVLPGYAIYHVGIDTSKVVGQNGRANGSDAGAVSKSTDKRASPFTEPTRQEPGVVESTADAVKTRELDTADTVAEEIPVEQPVSDHRSDLDLPQQSQRAAVQLAGQAEELPGSQLAEGESGE